MMKVRVFVSLQKDVMDPQGETIRAALKTLGFDGVTRVDTGKFFTLTFDSTDRNTVEENVKKIAHDVLSNPVIEDFSYEIEPE